MIIAKPRFHRAQISNVLYPCSRHSRIATIDSSTLADFRIQIPLDSLRVEYSFAKYRICKTTRPRSC